MNEDNTNNNDNTNEEKPFYTKEGFKSLIRQSPFNHLQREQYKYRSHDSRFYILAYHEGDTEEDTFTYWSKYHSHNDELVESEGQGKEGERKITLTKEFQKMLDDEDYIREGSERIILP